MLQLKEEVYDEEKGLLIQYETPYESYVTEEITSEPSPLPISCPHCDKKFKSQSQLKNHMWRHTGEKPFKCGFCNAGFTQHGNLKAHFRIHSGEKPFKCFECNNCFTQMSNLKSHMKIHTGERPYKCFVCDAAFRQATNLKTHLAIHTGERPYVCNVCWKTFTQKSNLKAHARRMHPGQENFISYQKQTQGQLNQTSELQTPIAIQSNRNTSGHMEGLSSSNNPVDLIIEDSMPINNIEVKTEITEEKPANIMISEVDESQFQDSLFNPLESDLKKTIYVEPSSETNLICSLCFYPCSTKAEYIKHSWLHQNQRKLICSSCSKTFTSFFEFTHHLKLHALKFGCEICELSFSSKKKLYSHYECHRIQSHSCLICGLKFRKLSGLRNHSIKQHGNGLSIFRQTYTKSSSEFKCSFCGYHCPSKSSFIKHKSFHLTSQKILRCSLCESKFSHKKLLDCHKKYRHSKLGRLSSVLSILKGKKYKCPYCFKSFHSISSLRLHLHRRAPTITRSKGYSQSYWHLIKKFSEATKHVNDDKSCFLEMCLDPGEVDRKDVVLKISCTDKENFSRKPNPIFTCHDCRAYFSSLPKIKEHMKTHIKKPIKPENETVLIISEDFNVVELNS